MKYLTLAIACFFLLSNISCSIEQNYIFFLHNKFLEDHPLEAEHPDYGRAEYQEIITKFEQSNFKVISEKRPANTTVQIYAKKVVHQIDSLIQSGFSPEKITVIGTSKGGFIAQYVSTYLANPKVNFVFVGSFQEIHLTNFPKINYCGNILNIYEVSDAYGVSAIKRKETSKLPINHFREVELNTQLNHGFLFKALDDWMIPAMNWANQNYNFKEK